MAVPRVEKPCRVGDLAQMTGKTVRTLHFYEELGLLEPKARTKGGFRLYDEEDVQRVTSIDRLHELGFSLGEIQDIVKTCRLSPNGIDATPKLREVFKRALQETRQKLSRLKEVEKELSTALHFIEECGRCELKPVYDQCCDCARGDHHAHLPPLVNAFVPKQRCPVGPGSEVNYV
ncbi:MAG: MerR family transcriptional regulator [Planctomycetes bacterium]|nr:MerR family transcriptional regulator [Planctomycetota bacterium]